ncbi:MAG: hypothetical protein OHK0022_17200 [Roseiflexaceae bacterium]
MHQDVVVYLRTVEAALEVWFRQMGRGTDTDTTAEQRAEARRRLAQMATELNQLDVPLACEPVHRRLQLALRRWIVAEELREYAPESPITRRAQRSAALAFVAFRTELD